MNNSVDTKGQKIEEKAVEENAPVEEAISEDDIPVIDVDADSADSVEKDGSQEGSKVSIEEDGQTLDEGLDAQNQYQDVADNSAVDESILTKFKNAWQDPKKRIGLIVLGIMKLIVIYYLLGALFHSEPKSYNRANARSGREDYVNQFMPKDEPMSHHSDSSDSAVSMPKDSASTSFNDSKEIEEDNIEAMAPLPPAPPVPLEPIAPMNMPEVDLNAKESFSSYSEKDSDDEELNEKMEVSSTVFEGGSETGKSDHFMGFDGGVIEAGEGIEEFAAAKVSATKIKSLGRMVLQGKIIDAVVENAINTQVDGDTMIRAIISRDVYAEQGKNIVIPKGSRVIGSYSKGGSNGGVRIKAGWSRVITPDGINVELRGQATDDLGRAGMIGKGHDMIMNKVISTLLISYAIPYMAMKLDNDKDDKNNVTISEREIEFTDSNGSKHKMKIPAQESDTKDDLVKNVTDSLTKIGEDYVNKRFPSEPVIVVPQGARIKIFVAQDIVFPAAAIAPRH